MNRITVQGQGQSVAGNVKEAVGQVTGDDQLQQGRRRPITGDAKQMIGAAKDAIRNLGPLLDEAKAFAEARPSATAAVVGTLGIALINTLRGKRPN